MADFRYTCEEEARLLHSSIVQASVPRGYEGRAEPKFSGTFGIGKKDFDAIVKLEVAAINEEFGSFTGKPTDYYLACTSGEMAARRVLQRAELAARNKASDEVFRLKEKAERRAAMYREHAGILQASSKFEIALARIDNGAIKDIADANRVRAGKDFFYPGAFVVPSVQFKAYARKTVEDRDSVTAYLQNVLFLRNGDRLGGVGGVPNQDVFGNFKGYSKEDPTALAPGNNSGDSGFGNDLENEAAF